MHYLMFYEYSSDYLERRGEFRNAHLTAAWASNARGELLLGGAFTNPADGAVMIFAADSPAVAENFAKADPSVINGLVKRWHVREWATVVGAAAVSPIRPTAV